MLRSLALRSFLPLNPCDASVPLDLRPLQQKQVEQEEEYITNKLMKRLEQLKKEKAVLASEVRLVTEILATA